MNSQTIVRRIAKTAGVTDKFVGTIVALFLDAIVGELESGNKVSIKGLGTFLWRKAPARKIYSPTSEETLDVPERMMLKFRPAQKLRRRPCATKE